MQKFLTIILAASLSWFAQLPLRAEEKTADENAAAKVAAAKAAVERDLAAKVAAVAADREFVAIIENKIMTMTKTLGAKDRETVLRLCQEKRFAEAMKMAEVAAAKTEPAAATAKAESIEEALAHKVSCEFVDTPIKDVFAFLQTLKKINLIISTPAQTVNTAINLRVADMPAGDVLKYVCKLANLSVEIQDQAVYIAKLDEGADNFGTFGPQKEQPVPAGTKLRIKLGNGNEFEADGAIFNNKPELLEKLVERFLKDGKDEKK